MPLFYLVYVSSATRLFSKQELNSLLSEARAKNSAKGITGLLLYSEGNFIQLLEGEREVIETLYKTIEADPRHKNVIKVLEGELSQRNFSEWSMGYRSISSEEHRHAEGLLDLKDDQVLKLLVSDEHPAVMFLKTFYKINVQRTV
jgi:hypothetical protein